MSYEIANQDTAAYRSIYPHIRGKSAPVRGVWTKQAGGSVKQEFLQFNEKTDAWETFFVGVSRRKLE